MLFGLFALAAGTGLDRLRRLDTEVRHPDHAFWLSFAGLIFADIAAPQVFPWASDAGVAFILIQVAATAAALGAAASLGAIIYLEWQINQLFPSGGLLAALTAVVIRASALFLGIFARRYAKRRPAPARGSPWL